MKEKEARKRIEKLKKLIDHHRYLYHVCDRQEISPEALDSLKKELFDLEERFPHLVTPDSPTQRVGGKPLEKFEKTRHYTEMLSLQDAFEEKDMLDFEKRLKRITEEEFSFFCEAKMDGLAVELVYSEGLLVSASTRGDGRVGEEVLENIKTIEAVPLSLTKEESIVVRGEVFITKEEFLRLNEERKKEGLPLYANPRNIAAGSVRQLDPKVAASRNLDFFAYDLVCDAKKGDTVTPLGTETHQEKHHFLRDMGLKVVPYEKECYTMKEVFDFYKKVSEQRKKLSYEIDGVAVIVNENRIFSHMGTVGKAPRGAIAYKFPLKQRTSVIEDVLFQVGRTGVVTPVALLSPVSLGGVVVSRATLHNEDEIKRLDARMGDSVVVGRAGDVIPRVVKVLKELRTGKEKVIRFPKKCPLCSSRLLRPEGEARWYCKNKQCYGVRKERFAHFVSKKGFDIEGLGEKVIDKLLSEGVISHPADLFALKEGDLAPLERFADKSAKNIVSSIEKSKEVPFSRFLYALSIPHVGEQTARLLSYRFKDLSTLKKASLEEIMQIPDIGPSTAQSVFDFMRENEDTFYKLQEAGIKIKSESAGSSLKGKSFVITGTLSISREEAKKGIINKGGRVSSSVSSSTDYLVCGNDPGSKLERAKELGVEVINENQLMKIL